MKRRLDDVEQELRKELKETEELLAKHVVLLNGATEKNASLESEVRRLHSKVKSHKDVLESGLEMYRKNFKHIADEQVKEQRSNLRERHGSYSVKEGLIYSDKESIEAIKNIPPPDTISNASLNKYFGLFDDIDSSSDDDAEEMGSNFERTPNPFVVELLSCFYKVFGSNTEDHVLMMVMAIFLGLLNEKWEWTFTLLCEITVKMVSASTLMTDMVSHLMPGGIACGTLMMRLNKTIQAIVEDGIEVPMHCDIIYEFDNAGKYDGKPSRPRSNTLWSINIISLCEVFCLIEKDKPCLQSDPHHSPMRWKRFEDVPLNILELNKEELESWDTFRRNNILEAINIQCSLRLDKHENCDVDPWIDIWSRELEIEVQVEKAQTTSDLNKASSDSARSKVGADNATNDDDADIRFCDGCNKVEPDVDKVLCSACNMDLPSLSSNLKKKQSPAKDSTNESSINKEKRSPTIKDEYTPINFVNVENIEEQIEYKVKVIQQVNINIAPQGKNLMRRIYPEIGRRCNLIDFSESDSDTDSESESESDNDVFDNHGPSVKMKHGKGDRVRRRGELRSTCNLFRLRYIKYIHTPFNYIVFTIHLHILIFFTIHLHIIFFVQVYLLIGDLFDLYQQLFLLYCMIVNFFHILASKRDFDAVLKCYSHHCNHKQGCDFAFPY